MSVALEQHQRDGLEAILKARLGVDKDAERAQQKQGAAAILQRCSIASGKERHRLEDYAEMLEATGGDPAELAAIGRLL